MPIKNPPCVGITVKQSELDDLNYLFGINGERCERYERPCDLVKRILMDTDCFEDGGLYPGGDVLLIGNDGNAYSLNGTFTETPLTVTDSSTINLTAGVEGNGHTGLTGSVKLSDDTGQIIEARADGLFAEIPDLEFSSPNDTIETSASGPFDNLIEIDVKLSGNEGNILTVDEDGGLLVDGSAISVGSATTTVEGIAMLAQVADLTTGTNNAKIVTPLLTRQQRGKLKVFTYENLITYTVNYPDGSPVENGDIAKVTTLNRGLYQYNSTSAKWVSLNGGAFNVMDFGAVPDGVTDCLAAFQAAYNASTHGDVIIIPRGRYYLSASWGGASPRRVIGVGQSRYGSDAFGTAIVGNFNDYLFKFDLGAIISGFAVENMMLTNYGATGGCIYAKQLAPPAHISNVRVEGYRGITISTNGFTTFLSNIYASSANGGWATGGWGIFAANHTSMYNVDINGHDNGIRVCGGNMLVSNARIEMNHTGLVAGRDEDGNSYNAGLKVYSTSFEANDRGIWIAAAALWSIENCGVLAQPYAPSGQSAIGIQIDATNMGTISDFATVGGFSDASAVIDGRAAFKNVFLQNDTEDAGSGVTWDIAAPQYSTFENTNYDSDTDGDLTIGGKITAGNILSRIANVSIGSTAKPFRYFYLYGDGTRASHSIKFTSTPTDHRTQTFPDNTGIIPNLNLAQSWSALQTFLVPPSSPGAGTGSEEWGINANLGSTTNSTGLGNGVTIAGNSSTGLGSGVNIGTGILNVAVGYNATISDSLDGCVLLGADSHITAGGNSVGVGRALNIAHSGCVVLGLLGASTANNQFIVGGTSASFGISDVYIGDGVVNASPLGFTLNATGGSGTNIAGAQLSIAGGKGTGNAAGGNIVFKTSDAGSSGTTLQTLSDKMTISPTGVTINKVFALSEVAVTATSGGTTTLNLANGNIQTVTMPSGNTIIAVSNVPKGLVAITIIQDAIGGRTVTWNSVFKWAGAVAPFLSTDANARDTFLFLGDGTNLYILSSVLNVS
jgi:hypothetical protein